MNLTIETALHGVAHALRERIAPALQDPFAGEAARLAGIIVTLCAMTVDNAAAVRAEENSDVRMLFAAAVPIVTDDALALQLSAAARSSDPGLKISELDRESARLRGLLVELHAHVEALNGAEAREIDHRIWRLLRAVEAARFPG